jgi:hypothetical protein
MTCSLRTKLRWEDMGHTLHRVILTLFTFIVPVDPEKFSHLFEGPTFGFHCNKSDKALNKMQHATKLTKSVTNEYEGGNANQCKY